MVKPMVVTPEDLARAKYYDFFDFLRQKKLWRDRDGTLHMLDTMDPGHRHRLLAYLERNAERIRWSDQLDTMSSFPENPSDGVWSTMMEIEEELDREIEMPIDEWLSSLPLVKRLRKLAKADEGRVA